MTQPIDRVLQYQQMLQPYTDPNVARLKRHWQFLISDTHDIVFFRVSAVTSIAVGFCSGTAAGLKITDGNRVAGAAGGFGGSVVAGLSYMTITERTKQYKQWVDVKMDYIIDSSIYSQYSEDSLLKNFVCPIKQTFSPVLTRTPNGHLMDFNELMKCPRDENGHIKDPMRGPSFSENTLEPAWESNLFINKRMYFLITMDINAAGESGAVKDTLLRQLKKTVEGINACYRGCFVVIDHKFINKEITYDEAQEERNSFVDCFGKVPEHQLDWGLDWKGILDKRWIAANPDGKIFG